MRVPFAGTIKRLAWATGYYERALARRSFPGVAVLCYHGVTVAAARRDRLPHAGLHVDAGEFEAHCALIAAHCQPLALREAMAIWAGEAAPLPRPVLVTFDDGYRSLLQVALPILRRHGVPATVFACTGPIANGTAFWFDDLARSRGESAAEAAKALPYAEWRALVETTGGLATRHLSGDPLAPLSVAEFTALAHDPLVSVGAHTATHPILARAPEAVQRDEIARSLDAIAGWTGARPTSFAYPNGRPGADYDDRTRSALRDAAVTVAFSTHEGWAHCGEPPLDRSRFVMRHGTSAAELAHRMCHSW
ncbi:MAG: polysaccharide deacetylase family protein [Gemmatimonadetes bacterium]|nr:polysaccharide deacetylase family protein [Gemmatimonadota bacterium]